MTLSSEDFAKRLRCHALRMVHRANSSHIGSSLSMADLIAVLYGEFLRIDPKSPEAPDRDRFILSKGHSAAILYAALAERGFFETDWLERYCEDGSALAGHISHKGLPGVEVSTGSLGHGLSIGCGFACAAKADGRDYRVVAMMSDGECDEGSVWEAVLFAAEHRLDNLIAIVDYNKIQSFGRVDEILDLEPLTDKWESFRWSVSAIDGHSHDEIKAALAAIPFEAGKPSVIIAHTVKGKGVGFMEDKLEWHYRAPDAEQLKAAIAEVENG